MKRRKSQKTPSFRHHKATGQGFVEFGGHRVYLGVYGRSETEEHYHQVVTEWLANGRELPVTPNEITVAELIARYWNHAERYYRGPDGKPTTEQPNIRQAVRPLVTLYGQTLAAEFSPRRLKAVRQSMVDTGNSRTYTNSQISRIRSIFRWAVGEELVIPSVHHALAAVAGLKRGRSAARETEPITPVPDAYIDAVRPFVSRQVLAMIDLQLLTGARAGELVKLRPVDLDTTGRVWLYSPVDHKCAFRGHNRTIYLGPKSQDIVKPFLDRPVDAFCFAPREAEAERYARASCHRRVDQKPNDKKTDRTIGEHYTTGSYRRAIHRACEEAYPVPDGANEDEGNQWRADHRWSPHRLRHNAATRLRREFGIDLAQTILGHRLGSSITEIYAEANTSKAISTMLQVG